MRLSSRRNRLLPSASKRAKHERVTIGRQRKPGDCFDPELFGRQIL